PEAPARRASLSNAGHSRRPGWLPTIYPDSATPRPDCSVIPPRTERSVPGFDIVPQPSCIHLVREPAVQVALWTGQVGRLRGGRPRRKSTRFAGTHARLV